MDVEMASITPKNSEEDSELLKIDSFEILGVQDFEPLTDEFRHIKTRKENFGFSNKDIHCGFAASGGGIRSSAFNCGILFGLSETKVLANEIHDHTIQNQSFISQEASTSLTACSLEANALSLFDFMSCVSGGGFTIGAFITELASYECADHSTIKEAINNVRERMIKNCGYVTGCYKKSYHKIIHIILLILCILYSISSPLLVALPIGVLILVVYDNFILDAQFSRKPISFYQVLGILFTMTMSTGIFYIIAKNLKFFTKMKFTKIVHNAQLSFGTFFCFLFYTFQLFVFINIKTPKYFQECISLYFFTNVVMFFITNPRKIRIKFTKQYFKDLIIDILLFIFGIQLFVLLTGIPLIIQIKLLNNKNYTFQKVTKTIILMLFTARYIKQIYLFYFKDFAYSFAGMFQRNSISNAFFNKTVSWKLNTFNKAHMPLIISNSTLNDIIVLDDKINPYGKVTSTNFMVTPYSMGSRLTGFQKTESDAKLDKFISISAAAISYSLGELGKKYVLDRFFLFIFSLNFGAYIRPRLYFNPLNKFQLFFINLSHFFLLFGSIFVIQIKNIKFTVSYVLFQLITFVICVNYGNLQLSPIINHYKQCFYSSSLLIKKQVMLPQMFLSDGGHIENLGLFALLVRKCKFIVVGDGGYDPDVSMNDLISSIKFAKKSGLIEEYSFDKEQWSELINLQKQRKHILIKVKYKPGSSAIILFIKLKLKNPKKFYIDKTSNQFFGKEKFENYFNMGKEYLLDAINSEKEHLRKFGFV